MHEASKSLFLINRVLGEGPRSGGGEALSGAGAKRREGAPPPVDFESSRELAS